MDSIHDMGGTDDFGRLDIEQDEPVFHEPWEDRGFAMNIAMGAWGKWNCPSSKHLGLLSLFHKGGSGSSWIDVKPLVVDGSSGGVG